MRPFKDSDYEEHQTAKSIDKSLNDSNFRKNQNLTLRLNQRPQRLEQLKPSTRNSRMGNASLYTKITSSLQTAPTSTLGQAGSPFRPLSLKTETSFHNKFQSAADRYKSEVNNIVCVQSAPIQPCSKPVDFTEFSVHNHN